jgi:HPt (histidine-containing phosphotransfer) domain-containing protein
MAEMLALFESETRARLGRLAAGAPDAATLLREVHTLKGAAGTVCAARLARHAARIEERLRNGGTLAAEDVPGLSADFDAWLDTIRTRPAQPAQAA